MAGHGGVGGLVELEVLRRRLGAVGRLLRVELGHGGRWCGTGATQAGKKPSPYAELDVLKGRRQASDRNGFRSLTGNRVWWWERTSCSEVEVVQYVCLEVYAAYQVRSYTCG